MKDKTVELFKANSDVLILLHLVSDIGWSTIREQSVQRIIYISKVLFSFVNPNDDNLFINYHFSVRLAGPYSSLVDRSILDLKKSELISDEDGKLAILDGDFVPDKDASREKWLKTIVYILGLYGESRIFNFTIRDPLYKEAVESKSVKDLDTSPENTTIKVLNEFKKAFEETIEDTSSIDNKEYLELYFEYVFSKIITRKAL